MSKLGIRINDKEAGLYKGKDVIIFHLEHPTLQGHFVMTLIEKWGMVSAKEDGEDSVGRAKLRTLTPQEVVTRAMDVAEIAFKSMRQAGLIIDLPDLNEINVEGDKQAAEERRINQAERAELNRLRAEKLTEKSAQKN